jgi:hypothetical protein
LAISYLSSINLNQNQLLNARIHNLPSAPDSPVAGQMYYNTTFNRLFVYDGGSWIPASGEYIHPNDGGGSISTPLTGASVISAITVNSLGHVTSTATRALTPADIGAATSTHTHTYAQVMTSLTGSSSTATNGQLLIGDGTDFTKATLTAGPNITITNGPGSITISATDTNTTYSVPANDPITLSGTVFSHSTADGHLHVPATGTTNSGKFLKAGATAGSFNWQFVTKSDVGLGNVTNDAQIKKASSSTVGYVPTWSVTTGDALGAGYAVEATLTGSSSALPRADAVKTYVDNLLGANDAMVFKGTLGTGGTVTSLPTTYSAGWTYKVITAGTYAGKVCEVGDMIVAIVDRSGTGNTDDDWTVIQTNIDGAIVGPTSATADAIALFNGTSGKLLKNSGVLLSTLAPLASPAFTGTPTAPTAAVGTNTTQIATTAFVIGQASNTTPLANSGSGSVGTSTRFARADHVHPATSLKYSATITGGSTSEVITHNFNTRDVIVQLYRTASPYDIVYTDVEITTVNAVTLRFNTAPAAGEYRVVIMA